MERRRIIETWPAEAGPPPDLGGPLFLDAEVRPNRSLPNVGFLVLMGALILVSFTAGMVFVSMGAWPVIGFFGLDIALVWLAFRMSYRDGRRLERVQINREEIRVGRRWPTGHSRCYRLPAAWARVEIDGAGEPDAQTRLSAKGKTLIIGAVLSPKERVALGEAVRDALDRARQPDFSAAQEPGGAQA